MSRMSELHADLGTIHSILLGQRKLAQDQINLYRKTNNYSLCGDCLVRVETINDLLLEFEAAGVVWPDNVVSLNTVTPPSKCGCGGDIHPEHGPWG